LAILANPAIPTRPRCAPVAFPWCIILVSGLDSPQCRDKEARMARVLGLAVLTLLTLIGAASAQENWLIGTWLTTRMDPRGVSNYAMASRFEPNGRLIIQMAVSGSGGSGMQTFLATWRMTGPSSYVAQIIDYEPKQSCGAMGCITVPPTIPMG